MDPLMGNCLRQPRQAGALGNHGWVYPYPADPGHQGGNIQPVSHLVFQSNNLCHVHFRIQGDIGILPDDLTRGDDQ